MGHIIKFAPTFNVHVLRPIVRSTDLGNHQVNELGDGLMAIEQNTVDMDDEQLEALSPELRERMSIHLDELEQLKLYMLLEAKFKRGGQL